jgi:peroxiredoxin
MKRIRLDRDRQSRPAPYFRLTAQSGEDVGLADYRDRANLVLTFFDGLAAPALQEALDAFAAREARYRAQNAEVLAIVEDPAAALASRDEGAGTAVLRVLADPEGDTRRAYAALLPAQPEPGEVMVFVLDRFGAPHVAFLSRAPADPALHEKLLSWLLGIEIECPE